MAERPLVSSNAAEEVAQSKHPRADDDDGYSDPADQTKGRSSDGEHCQDCGETYGDFVYKVPDDVWALITPKPDQPGAGLLCPTCAARRATDAGIYLEWAAARG